MAAFVTPGGTYAGIDWADGTDCTQILIVQVDGDGCSNGIVTYTAPPITVEYEEDQAIRELRKLNARRAQEGVRTLQPTHSKRPSTNSNPIDTARAPRPTIRRTATAARNWRRQA